MISSPYFENKEITEIKRKKMNRLVAAIHPILVEIIKLVRSEQLTQFEFVVKGVGKKVHFVMVEEDSV